MTIKEAFGCLELDGNATQQEVHDAYINLHTKLTFLIANAPTAALQIANEKKLQDLQEAYLKVLSDCGYQPVTIEETPGPETTATTTIRRPQPSAAPVTVTSSYHEEQSDTYQKNIIGVVAGVLVLSLVYYFWIHKPGKEREQEMEFLTQVLEVEYHELKEFAVRKEKKLQELSDNRGRSAVRRLKSSHIKEEIKLLKSQAEDVADSVNKYRSQYVNLHYYNAGIAQQLSSIDSMVNIITDKSSSGR